MTTRRDALEILVGGAMAALGLGHAAEGLAASQERVVVGRLEDVPPGSALAAEYRDAPVLILNVEGEIRVFSAICMHEGCTVEWDAGQETIVCPCHDGRYDLEGNVLSGPPPAPLLRFESKVVDGAIVVL
jgi:cytochrome b6-f complex iron-sulfur subunit